MSRPRLSSRCAVWLFVVAVTPTAAKGQIFSDDFRWGDTSGWSATVPERCERVETIESAAAPTSEIHVATWGSDDLGDGSEANPFASVTRAAAGVSAGAAIRIHPGIYAGGVYLADLAGTPDAPIWIGGIPGEPRPRFEGGTEGIHLTRVRHLVIHDLEITGAGANGINCDDGGAYDDPSATHHIVFRGLFIHNIGSTGNQDCLKLSGVNHYWVMHSEFESCGGGYSGSGVDHVGCHHGLIVRNRFQNLSANAVQSKGGSADIEIRWNRFLESGQRGLNMGGSTGFEYFRPPLSESLPNAEARDIRVVANLFMGSEAAVAYVGCVGCVVANNTIIDPHNWILRILQETTSSPPYVFESCRDGVFVNNLVSYSWDDLSTWINIGPGTAAESFTFSNNLWYAWDEPAQSQPVLPVTETDGVYGQDPELDGRYGIGISSPAAGSGAIVPWAWGDLRGACYADPPSIGAFEVSGREVGRRR